MDSPFWSAFNFFFFFWLKKSLLILCAGHGIFTIKLGEKKMIVFTGNNCNTDVRAALAPGSGPENKNVISGNQRSHAISGKSHFRF